MYGFVDTVPGSGTGSTSLMSIRTILNGKELDQELTDETGSFTTLTVNGRNDTSSSINSFSVPGMDGAHEEGNTIDPKTINVRFRIKDKTNEGFRKRLNRLNALLSGSKIVLEFTDEDAIFYATVSSVSLPDEDSNDLIGNIYFYCSDPYKYGPEVETTFTSDSDIVTNNGTAPAKPIFELKANAPTTFAMVSNGDDYMMVGRSVNVEEDEPFQRYELIYSTNGSTTTGWANGSSVDGGVVAGTMGTTGTRFEASSYGTGTRWHGPAIKQSLPEVLTDFRMNAFVTLLNARPDRVGRVEIYLLDVNDNVVAKVAMKDIESYQALGWGTVRAGEDGNGHLLIDEYGDTPGNWNDFSGLLRIEREGNLWSAYIAMVDPNTGQHHTRQAVEWRDTENKYTRNVAQVQVHMAQFGDKPTVVGGVNFINIFKINQEPEGVPYIADEGDIITLDHDKKMILVNGEIRKDLISMGSNFLTLKPGINPLEVMPEQTFNTKIRYREPFR